MTTTVEVIGGTGAVRWNMEHVPPSWGLGQVTQDGRRLVLAGRVPMGCSENWNMTVAADVGGDASAPFEIADGLPAAIAPLRFDYPAQVFTGFGVQGFEITLPRPFFDEFLRRGRVVVEVDVRNMYARDSLRIGYGALTEQGASIDVQDARTYDDMPPPRNAGDLQTIQMNLHAWKSFHGLSRSTWSLSFQLDNPRGRQPIAVDQVRVLIW